MCDVEMKDSRDMSPSCALRPKPWVRFGSGEREPRGARRADHGRCGQGWDIALNQATLPRRVNRSTTSELRAGCVNKATGLAERAMSEPTR